MIFNIFDYFKRIKLFCFLIICYLKFILAFGLCLYTRAWVIDAYYSSFIIKLLYKNIKKKKKGMKNYLSGVVGVHVHAVKKQLKGAIFAVTLGAAIPVTSQAIELENPNMCSSGITNMMSDMGLMAYSMANFMNGFCKSMPFFGMFCPDLDKMAGSFFSKVLQSPDLTLDLLACADQNTSMLNFMLHVIDDNPALLSQMGNYMGQTGDGDTISPVNTVPSVSIDYPSTGSVSTAGEVNTFAATASDNEDGMISANVNGAQVLMAVWGRVQLSM